MTKESSRHVVCITGAAGYVGAMLAHEWAKRDDVEYVIGIDKEPEPDLLAGNPKVRFLQANTVDSSWEEEVRAMNPDIIVHCAWQIRSLYGDSDTQKKWNIEGSNHIFDFAFSTPTVKRLIHFSTVASYAAYPTNTFDYRFTEKDSFRESDYAYAEEKRKAEEELQVRYSRLSEEEKLGRVVSVVRPAAITGPRGRKMRIRFGLQSVLSGELKTTPLYRFLSWMVSVIPATQGWARQFVHEDDVCDIVTLLAFDPRVTHRYEVFTMCPPGKEVRAEDFAHVVGKRVVLVPPWLVRIAYFLMWHLTRGRVPTSRGAWKSYSYPILVDGSKITDMYGYQYKADSFSAFRDLSGRYESYIKTGHS